MSTNEESSRPGRKVSDEQVAELEGMVRAIAIKVRQSLGIRLDKEDLIQLGMLGLCEAADRYDPESGVTLGTFAYTRIHGAILDGVGKMTGVRRSHARRVRRLKAMNEAAESHDMAATAESPADYVSAAIGGVLFAASLAEIGEDRIAAAEDGESPFTAPPDHRIGRRQMREVVLSVLDELPEDEASLLREHYVDGRSLQEIGEERGVSRSWASRIHTRALRRARELLTTERGVELSDLSEATWR